MMFKNTLKFLLLTLLVSLPAKATTYYIANGGSNTAAGTETAPWAQAPGMNGVSGTPANYSCVAGDTFILKGGDTWAASNWPWNWACSGTSAAHVTITVSQTWFDGSSWTRPVLTGGGTWPGSLAGGGINKCFLNLGANYVDESWLEWTGMYWTGI